MAELLARSRAPGLAPRPTEVTDWIELIRRALPAVLALRVVAVERRRSRLIVAAESAAWSTRLRFALAEVAESIRRQHPGIEAIEVRVAPDRPSG